MLVHAAALWALAAGLAREPSPVVVPVTLLAELMPAPSPAPAPAPAAPRQVPAPAPQAIAPPVRALQAPAEPAVTPSTPAAFVPVVPVAPSSAGLHALTPDAAPVGKVALEGGLIGAALPPSGTAGLGAPGAGSAAGSARLELPSSDAAYLRNPAPAYPPRSRHLGEQGRVVVRVLVDAEGSPQRAQVHQSSGHARLDQAALTTVLQWRYVPGRRAGVPEAMWLNVPISFVLE